MPTREAVANHKKAIKRILIKFKGTPLGAVIKHLASRIKGWTWYHSVTQATLIFSRMDNWLYQRLWK